MQRIDEIDFLTVFLKPISRSILLGIVYYLISDKMSILSFSCSLYYLAGKMLKHDSIYFQV